MADIPGAGAMPYVAAGSALLSYMGSKSAASSQADAAAHAADIQKYIYDQQRADAEPWRQAGIGALGQINSNLADYTRNFGASDFTRDPGYQFRLDQGQKGVENSASARGMTQSGAQMKALDRYNSDYASNEYQNAYDRFNNDRTTSFNRLSNLAGMGQTSNNQLSAAGSNYANQASEAAYQGGNAASAGSMAGANAVNQGVGNWMNFTLANTIAGKK